MNRNYTFEEEKYAAESNEFNQRYTTLHQITLNKKQQ